MLKKKFTKTKFKAHQMMLNQELKTEIDFIFDNTQYVLYEKNYF